MEPKVVDGDDEASFTDFTRAAEPKIRQALTPLFGVESGREATADALAYGWEHWARVREMENPIGYLYTVGRSRGRRAGRRRVALPAVPHTSDPWVEPALPAALSGLPKRQRQVVMLIHCYGWTQSEAAELLSVSRPTVQTHLTRAMDTLRRRLGVRL